MVKKKFKDKCDECKNFGFCKGYKGRILCEKCLTKIKQQ